MLIALAPAAAQGRAPSAGDLALRFAAMTAVTGYEQAMADTVLTLLPGAVRDRAGNVVLTFGRGEPRRLAACPMDETGYAVGRVRPDGLLTLRRSPARFRPPGPLVDQQLEGQRVTVFGARGARPGVVAVRSIHLTRGREPPAASPFSVDDAYVDVGARDEPEVAALGIAVLAPVSLAKRPHRYGTDRLAAPVAGRRAACAALVAAARRVGPGQGARTGTAVVALVVEQNLSARGLLTLATTLGPFTETWIFDAAGGTAAFRAGDLLDRPVAALGTITAHEVGVRYPGTPVETVSLGDVERLSTELQRWILGEGGT